jgi:histidinol-phosphate phosphatase family protein
MNILEEIDHSWTLFLDRDGVINKRIPDGYVTRVEEFEFLPGSKKAIAHFASIFKYILVVTNQQGIGKGLMSEADLEAIHHNMRMEIHTAGGRIDEIYYCPELKEKNPQCRKPEIGMFLQACDDFPEIRPSKSIMVGDSDSDIQFGKLADLRLNVGIGNRVTVEDCDLHYPSLIDFAEAL